MQRIFAVLACLGPLIMSACTACTSCTVAPEAARPKPNVLLITIESLRADHVGAYGYPRNTTPNLDRLAARGTRFDNTVAQAPFTLPSIASLMTGQFPPGHGVRNHPGILAPELETRDDPAAALARARELRSDGDLLVLTGSIYLAGEIRSRLS